MSLLFSPRLYRRDRRGHWVIWVRDGTIYSHSDPTSLLLCFTPLSLVLPIHAIELWLTFQIKEYLANPEAFAAAAPAAAAETAAEAAPAAEEKKEEEEDEDEDMGFGLFD